MVPQIHQAAGFRAKGLGCQQARAPVLDHRGVKRWLKHLMFQEHAPVRWQGIIDLAVAVQITLELTSKMALTGEVGAVTNPHGECLATQLLTNLNTFQVVCYGLRANACVCMG